MKVKLSSFRRFKPAGIVICMLAAGICYSCRGPFDTQNESVMELKSGESLAQEMSGTARQVEEPSVAPVSGRISESDGNRDGDPVVVHVCGQVEKPGVYELSAGSRVYEAVRAAGGFADEAAGDYLNLAQEVKDGMKLEVPTREQADEWKNSIAVTGGQNFSEGGSVKVNINTASPEELMTLRGIGQSRAEDIIRYRDKFGGFTTIEDIMNVAGIKEAAFEKIKDSITV